MNKITIRKSNHPRDRLVYKGESLIATITHEKPSHSNNRQASYSVCRLTGRVDWHDTYQSARNDILKG